MITFSVSPYGSDQNTGAADSPLQTLTAAKHLVEKQIAAFTPGHTEDITVQLEPGTYRLNETLILGPEDGGDGSFQVIWQGSMDGECVVTSGTPLTDWKLCDGDLPDLPDALRGKVWVTDLPPGSGAATLYGPSGIIPRAEGEAIKPVLTPGTERNRWGPDGSIRAKMHGETPDAFWKHDRFGFAEGTITPASDFHEAEVVLIPKMQWTMNILPIKEVDFENKVVHLAQPCTYPIGVPECAPEGSIWIRNSLSVLSPGHCVFHRDSSRVYYCPASGTPDETLVVGQLIESIRIEGKEKEDGLITPVQGIRFRNLTFTQSNEYRFCGLTGKGIQHDWEMHDAETCMVRLRHARHCAVEHCTFTEAGSGGLRMDLACQHNRVEGCSFSNLGGCGVVLCGYGLSRNYLSRNNVVCYNHLHHLGQVYWHCPAIFIWQSGENHVADNVLHDLPYTGIVCSGRTVYDREGKGECSGTIDWDAVEAQCGKGYVNTPWYYSSLPSWWMREPLMHSRDNLIEYNRIHDVMQIMGDGNGIYISGAGGGNVVRFNVVGPCPSPHMAEALRCDDDQHHTILHGNLIYQQGGRATGITLKGVNRVTNNIIALPLTTPLRGFLSLETGPLNGSVIERNIFLSSAPDQNFVKGTRIHGTGRKARLRDTESNRNLFWCSGDAEAGPRFLAEAQSYGTDTDSLAVNPGFTDPENGDFTVKPDSPALQLGFHNLPLDRMFGKGD